MDDYIKFLIEETKREKAIKYNTGIGDKSSKLVIEPDSFMDKEERTIKNVEHQSSLKEENNINYSSKNIEKESVIINSNIYTEDKNNHSLITFDTVYSDKEENNLTIEENTINKEQVQIGQVSNTIAKTESDISIRGLQIEKEENNISSSFSPENKTSINVNPNYEEINKIGKVLESSSLTGAVDYIADSFGKPYLSISNFAFFNWRNFEENMSKMYDKIKYYPEESTASMISSYANLGTNISEADLVGVASSLINIASFTFGGKKNRANKGRYDLLLNPKFDNLDKEKTQKEIEDNNARLTYNDAKQPVQKVVLPTGEDINEYIEYRKEVEGYKKIIQDHLSEDSLEKEIPFYFEASKKDKNISDSSIVNTDISKKREDIKDEKIKSLYDAEKEEKEKEIGTSSGVEIDSEIKKAEEDIKFDEKNLLYDAEKNKKEISTSSGAEIDSEINKITKELESSKDALIYNFEKKGQELTEIKEKEFKRLSEEVNSIGYIYVSPVNIDSIQNGAKFIRIPLQSNLINNGENFRADYNTTDFLGRIGSVQQYVRTGSQSLSLETYYHVDSQSKGVGYTMEDLQRIEMMYKSLVFPRIKQVDREEYSFYTRPPIINIEIGNLSLDKTPLGYNSEAVINNTSKVINNFFTRVNYSDDTNHEVNLRDFIVTDLNIEKDYEKTPYYLEESSFTINNQVSKLYSPKDLMGFKILLTVTEIDPNYFGVLPSFDDYAKFATRA